MPYCALMIGLESLSSQTTKAEFQGRRVISGPISTTSKVLVKLYTQFNQVITDA